METPIDTLSNSNISPDQRRSLEMEYQIAFNMFQFQNSQAWQTFAVISTISLAGLVFVAQLKSGAAASVTWPATATIGLGMITVLLGWVFLSRRWWAFSQAELSRMRDIEKALGLYVIREGTWLRQELGKDELFNLSEDERKHYAEIRRVFPKFPKYKGRQQVITYFMVGALVVIWILFILADVLSLI